MGKIRIKKFKDMSLKWSFAFYVVASLLIALVLSALTVTIFESLGHNIYYRYQIKYGEEFSQTADVVVNGEVIQEDGLNFYTVDLFSFFTDRDLFLYDLYQGLQVFLVPIWFIVSIAVTGFMFYRRKIKKPLTILDEASSRIAQGDLDFKVEYDSKNEFGRVADSFETMRASLEELNREMWNTFEERKRLNAAFSHDLRTPLTVLKGYTEFLLKYSQDDRITKDKISSTLFLMDEHVERLENYVTSMNSLQKMDEITPSVASFEFTDLCEKLKTISEILAQGKQFTFASNGEGKINVDRDLIFQVTENLVANAARYAANRIRVTANLRDDVVAIVVSDDGEGFSQEALKKAQEPYYRDDENSSAHFGLGLYISKVLTEKHGGRLEISNNAEFGAQVTAFFKSL